MLDKLAVARALREMGLLLEVKGENPFKVRAYETGARALEAAEERSGRHWSLPGGSPSSGGSARRWRAKISELHLTGRTDLLDRLRAELRRGHPRALQVPDLGPKKIAALHAALGISCRGRAGGGVPRRARA